MAFQKEKTRDFGGSLFQQLDGILEISRSELKDSTRIVSQGNQTSVEVQEDTRKSYIQSIENFSYILKPYFDKDMKEVYNKCIKIITAYRFEMIKIIEKDYKEVYEKITSQIKGDAPTDLLSEFIIFLQMKAAKELFAELNMLLKRQNYLAKKVYGESDEETVIIDDDD